MKLIKQKLNYKKNGKFRVSTEADIVFRRVADIVFRRVYLKELNEWIVYTGAYRVERTRGDGEAPKN